MTQSPATSQPKSTQKPLFECPAPAAEAEPIPLVGTPRMKSPVRDEPVMHWMTLDETIPADSPARAVWDMVVKGDLTELFAAIKAVEGGVGRDAINPRVLLALWLYSTIEGISSARRIAKLTKRDDHFRWICGGVSVNRTSLASFYSDCPEVLDRLLTDYTAALIAEGLVNLNRVSLDGMRVRASAGKSSFRRDATLEELQKEAETQVERLAQERKTHGAKDDDETHQTPEESDAADRKKRVDAARAAIPELAKIREKRKKGDGANARASTTDPAARIMKMPNGGFNPALNVQIATANGSRIIVGIEVNNHGSDTGLITPMVNQITKRFGEAPKELLADGGFSSHEDIETAAAAGVTVISPIREEDKKRKKGIDPFKPVKGDSPAIAEWRKRMGEEATQEVYKERASTAEWVNAQARNRNLQQFRVRGLAKTRVVGLLFALAHNLTCGLTLRMQAAKAGA